MAIKNIYKSSMPSVNFVTRLGATLSFVEGRYTTANKQEIAELDKEIENGHPHIYVDKGEAQIDTEVVDAIAAAEAEARNKVLAEHAAKTGAVVSASGVVLSQPTAQAQTMTGQGLASAVAAMPTIRNNVGTVGVAGTGAVGAQAATSVAKS